MKIFSSEKSEEVAKDSKKFSSQRTLKMKYKKISNSWVAHWTVNNAKGDRETTWEHDREKQQAAERGEDSENLMDFVSLSSSVIVISARGAAWNEWVLEIGSVRESERGWKKHLRKGNESLVNVIVILFKKLLL